MAVNSKELKVGDKVRYMGGDVLGLKDVFTDGKEYVIKGKDEDGDAYLDNDIGREWYIYGLSAHCFELVDDDKSESTCNCDCKHDSHIVSLAKEVARLKRELSEHKEYIEKEVVLFDERLAEIESKKPSGAKAQYITVYGSEYIDKLFGGDGE